MFKKRFVTYLYNHYIDNEKSLLKYNKFSQITYIFELFVMKQSRIRIRGIIKD